MPEKLSMTVTDKQTDRQTKHGYRHHYMGGGASWSIQCIRSCLVVFSSGMTICVLSFKVGTLSHDSALVALVQLTVGMYPTYRWDSVVPWLVARRRRPSSQWWRPYMTVQWPWLVATWLAVFRVEARPPPEPQQVRPAALHSSQSSSQSATVLYYAVPRTRCTVLSAKTDHQRDQRQWQYTRPFCLRYNMIWRNLSVQSALPLNSLPFKLTTISYWTREVTR